MLYLVFFIILICLILMLFIQLNIEIEYIRNGWNEVASIKISVLGNLIKYKYEIPFDNINKDGFKSKRDKKSKNKKEQINKTKVREEGKEKDAKDNGGFSGILDRIEYFRDKYDKLNYLINNSLIHLKSKLKLDLFKVNMVIGTGDACWTGVLSGFTWAFVGFITAHLSNTFGVNEKIVDIKSDFSKPVFNVNILCIFNVRFGYVIIATIFVLFKTIGRRWFKCRNILYRVL